jgi:ribose transport system substrate-binding protein
LIESGKRPDRPQLGVTLAASRTRHVMLVIAKLDRLEPRRLPPIVSAGVDPGAADRATFPPAPQGGGTTMQRLLFAAMFAAAMFGLAPAPARAQQPTIPIIVKDTTSFYWQIVLAGARKAGQDLHVNVPELGAQSESDINGQISILENAVASKPAAIVISPTQFAALGRPIDDAAKSVKIIGIDSAADSKAFSSFLTTDNVQGGRAAADALAQGIASKNGGKVEGEVALITSLPGVGSLDQRAQGFKQQLAAKYPGLKLVADKVADGQATTALNIMTDLITANPGLKGVFASNLIMAQGAGQAIAENKLQNKIALVGFDNDDKLVKFLSDGVIYALIVQDPYRMGYDGIKTALAASKGQAVPAFVDTGVNTITKANMNTARSQELLNPKVK